MAQHNTASKFHPTHQKIIKLVESAAKKLKLDASADWRADAASLHGTYDAPFSQENQTRVQKQLVGLREAIWSLGDEEGFTVLGRDMESDGELSVLFQIDMDIDLDELEESDKLDEISRKFISEYAKELKKRRPKRKQHQLPDPSKSARASVNVDPLRKTFQVGARVSQETLDLIQKIRTEHGKSKREVIEEAIALLDQNLNEPS